MRGTRVLPGRVAVVGTGRVGSTFAYALLLSGLASEIVFVVANRAKAEGEATDLLRIVEAILRDQNTVLCVSSLIDGRYGRSDVCLSLPTVVNRRGVERELHLGLNQEELAGLRRSAGILRETIDDLELEQCEHPHTGRTSGSHKGDGDTGLEELTVQQGPSEASVKGTSDGPITAYPLAAPPGRGSYRAVMPQ